jgi:hypothetical protein
MERQRGARPRPRVDRDGATHVPHQQVRVEVLLAEFADPANPPGAQCVDDVGEFLAAGRQRICCATVEFLTLDDTGTGQRLQPFRQQRGRHLRHTAA